MKRALAILAALFTTLMAFGQEKPNQFEPEIQAFEKSDAAHFPNKGGILFIGSSSIRMWTSVTTDYPEYNVINRGFGGSTIADSTYFADRVVIPYAPRMIVLGAGTNDIANGKSADAVFDDYKAFVDKVRGKLPDVRIVYLSVTPAPSRWAKVEEVKKLNAMIADYDKKGKGLTFIDMFDQFITEGKPRPELFIQDMLHLNKDGYKIWITSVRPVLATSPEPK